MLERIIEIYFYCISFFDTTISTNLFRKTVKKPLKLRPFALFAVNGQSATHSMGSQLPLRNIILAQKIK